MLLVWNTIFMLAFLNRLVMKVVSLPMYVKVPIYVLGRACAWPPSVLWMHRGMGMEWGGVWLWIGKALFCRMFCMVAISVL